jgi:hypothetical protein
MHFTHINTNEKYTVRTEINKNLGKMVPTNKLCHHESITTPTEKHTSRRRMTIRVPIRKFNGWFHKKLTLQHGNLNTAVSRVLW